MSVKNGTVLATAIAANTDIHLWFCCYASLAVVVNTQIHNLNQIFQLIIIIIV